jgi:hypothetical protein
VKELAMEKVATAVVEHPSAEELTKLGLPTTERSPKFEIVDEETANWLVRKIVAARQYAERVKQWADAEQRRAQQEEQTLIFLFGRQAEQWAHDEIKKLNGRRKSLALPGGVVGFRTMNPSLFVDDERIVLGWARQNCPTAVTVVERLSKSALHKHFAMSGEVPAGAHLEPAREAFFIR